MVIGNGLLATSFEKYINNDAVVIFCSGVSNSLCEDINEYSREQKLLEESIANSKNSLFVYFSTCSIYEKKPSESKYVEHKLNIENYIQKNCNKYLIIRLSNVVGKTSNPNTVMNFFYNRIEKQIHFDLWSLSFRNLIDVQDVAKIVSYIINNQLFVNYILNVANTKSIAVSQLVKKIEQFLSKKAQFTLIEKGFEFQIDTSTIQPLIKELGIPFDHDYEDGLLKKYYLREL
jgi:nucleoside-diphosphate-sugar epimerase